ncbi:MAG TPA: NEW3 domain-containing protein [Bacillota bacterium]|nr:NEW3 domain-containing protein [Bacillota bacterium]
MKKDILLNLVLVVALLFTLIPAIPVAAASGIEISTTYPGITASPGEYLTFPLEIHNRGGASQVVQLRVEHCPEGWQASLMAQGRYISEVYVEGNSAERADLKVRVPGDAPEEVYPVTVAAVAGGSVLDHLQINININRTRSGDDSFKAQYAELQGPASATFGFKLSLTNNSSEEQSYSLGADLPSGWQITFKPSYEQQQVASITVGAGETKNLDANVTPAANVEAGEYTIPVYAVSATGEVVTELKVVITGTYTMVFSTPSGRLNTEVVAGRDKKVMLEVENSGSAALHGINFSSQTPDQWSVTFDPQSIDILKPGEKRQITATITAHSKAIAGDYVVSMRAAAKEAIEKVDFRVTVKTSTWWGLVGIIVVLGVCAGVYRVFRKYGRR